MAKDAQENKMVKTNICEVNFLEYAANRVLCVASRI